MRNLARLDGCVPVKLRRDPAPRALLAVLVLWAHGPLAVDAAGGQSAAAALAGRSLAGGWAAGWVLGSHLTFLGEGYPEIDYTKKSLPFLFGGGLAY